MFNYILYRIGEFIALHLPIKLCYGIAVFISDLRYIFVYRDRRAVRENLKVIFPEKSEGEIKMIRRMMFRNFAKYLADFFRFSKLDMQYLKKNIHLENMHYLDEALAKGRGAITLSAHLGNWELGGVVIGILGYPFWVVALPHKYKKVDNFFNFQRESKGVKVIPLGKAARQCLAALNKNEIVALVGDRDFTANGIMVNFFGKPTLLPEGPATFAIKTGASIVPGFMIRNADDSFTLRMEKPLERGESLLELLKRYNVIIEDYIRKYPEQWYMFRRFWRE